MDRSSLSRPQLVEILRADQWHLVALDLYMGSPTETARDVRLRLGEFWRNVDRKLVQIVADRLLEPDEGESLFSRPLVRERALEIARRLGTFDVPQAPESVRGAITEPTVDFLLAMGSIDLLRTYMQQWDRVEAMHYLAVIYALPPGEFMSRIPGAEDWVTRLTLTPESFREREIERIDALHPDLVSRRISAFEAGVRRNLGRFTGGVPIVFMVNVPQGDDYWRFRAERLQRIEEQICRIWPHYGQEELTQEDA